MTGARTGGLVAAILVTLSLALACGHGKDFLWVDDIPPDPTPGGEAYRIRPGDLIGVRVWNQDANSIDRTRVREDGKISLPFLNDVEVAGQEPTELALRLQGKLKTFIVNPVVTVVIHERPLLRISVLGEVVHPGAYELDGAAGVLHALAAAGGLTPFASSDEVYVIRRGDPAAAKAAPVRIRFRYADLRRAKMPGSVFRLRAGDVVVVE